MSARAGWAERLCRSIHGTCQSADSGPIAFLGVLSCGCMTLVLLGTFYTAMVGAGYLVELLFGATGLIPKERSATVMEAGISWNYTTWLNIAFLILAAVLLVRFFRTGGREMLSMMGGAPDATSQHDHSSGHGTHARHEERAAQGSHTQHEPKPDARHSSRDHGQPRDHRNVQARQPGAPQ